MRSSRRRIGLGVLLAVVAGAWYLQRQRSPAGEAPVAVPWPPLPPDPEGPVGAGREAAASPPGTTVGDGAHRPPETSGTWVAPCDGDCPDSHPVKVKLRSGLFHLPGMALYGRTKADRCYGSADSASADGYRASSR